MLKPVEVIQKLPQPGEPGAFATQRRYDIHTGVDLYCNEGDLVYALEDGIVVAVEAFTGSHADSPWWNDTWAVLVESASGVIVYGEIAPSWQISIGRELRAGEMLGQVIPVLKKDKGVTPTCMLHLELHKPGTTKTSWWHDLEARPESLLDPSALLEEIYKK